jgi:NADPH:quinone reductase-like Zn-dependent oxidoreductase
MFELGSSLRAQAGLATGTAARERTARTAPSAHSSAKRAMDSVASSDLHPKKRDKEADVSTNAMTIEGRAVLVTGANRGIGHALVDEALRRGAKRVYAGTRQPLVHPDERVTPLALDVTSAAQIQAAVERVESLDILINNAGISVFDDLSDRAALERHLAVNLFGTYGVTQAFLPLLTRSRGAIVNNVSLWPSPPSRSRRPTRSRRRRRST